MRDGPRVRALCLGPFTVVSLDLVEVSPELVAAVRRLVYAAPGAADRALFVAASHSHSGPGGTDPNPLAQLLGNGRFRPELLSAFAETAARTVALAHAAARPATLRLAQVSHPELQALRRPGGHADPRLTALAAVAANGARIATLVLIGAHPTLLPARERLLSADWPGAAARALEREGGVAMVLQGAGADVSPERAGLPEEPGQRIAAFGERVAQAAIDALRTGAELPVAPLGCARVEVALPPFDLSPILGPFHGLADRLAAASGPAETELGAVVLGGQAFACIPGELTGAAAAAWIARHPDLGRTAWISLCGGDVSYIEAGDLWRRGLGERELSLFGPELEGRLGEAIELASRAATQAATPPPIQR